MGAEPEALQLQDGKCVVDRAVEALMHTTNAVGVLARTMIKCLMKQCTAVCFATWDQGGPDRSSTPKNFMSPATTASKVSWHLAALAIACSIISIQRRVSASSQLVPNPVDHVKSFSSASCCSACSAHCSNVTTAGGALAAVAPPPSPLRSPRDAPTSSSAVWVGSEPAGDATLHTATTQCSHSRKHVPTARHRPCARVVARPP